MGKNAINYASMGWAWNALGATDCCMVVERGKQTKAYGLVSSLYAVNRVGLPRRPTLLYQQTNPYRVVAHPEPTDGCCV